MTASIATLTAAATSLRVLVVDDAVMIQRVLTRILVAKGAEVECFGSAEAALAAFESAQFDVVVADIRMPGMSGMEFLRHVRARDADLPVLMMTGYPEVSSATTAVELNASRYLAKPFSAHTLWEAVETASRPRRLERASQEDPGERDLRTLKLHFDDALEKVTIHFQPIVDLLHRTAIAYEVLCRSESEHIPYPDQLFSAAERLGRVTELGRAIRSLAGKRIGEIPADAQLFVNLHPAEMCDDYLLDTRGGLVQHAERVVFEITERETIDSVDDPAGHIGRLKAAGFRIAIDDLGAGYACLSSFIALEPDVVKVDMSLVRNVDLSPKKQCLIGNLLQLCAQMNTQVILEGVETVAERDALAAIGCRWMQGYLFARPTLTPQAPVFK